MKQWKIFQILGVLPRMKQGVRDDYWHEFPDLNLGVEKHIGAGYSKLI